jgi:hypothetical protein
LLTHDTIDGVTAVPGRKLRKAGPVMFSRFAQQLGGLALGVADTGKSINVSHFTGRRVDTVDALELAGEFGCQSSASIGDEARQPVAGGLVEGHI